MLTKRILTKLMNEANGDAPAVDPAAAVANAATTDNGTAPNGSVGGTGIEANPQQSKSEGEAFADSMDALFNDDDEESVLEEEPPVSSEASVEPAPPAAPAAEPPTPESSQQPAEEVVTPPESPIQTASQAQPDVGTGTPPPAEASAPEPEFDMTEARQSALAELEKRYALSQEDADAMISEPEKVLPKLAGQMYMDVFEGVLSAVQTMLPQAFTQFNQSYAAQQKDEADFYDAWPALKEHADRVLPIGKMYRQLNPQASKEQFIQEVGLQAMLALKLPIEGITQAPQQQTQQATPGAYAPPSGAPRAVTQRPAQQAPAKPTNAFTELADEWEEEM